MSKKSYSTKIASLMYDKFKSIEFDRVEDYLYLDKYTELAFCLAYMTLSKEKIIHKDKENNDPLGRLTRYVHTIDIDTLIDCDGIIIKYPDKYDNTWVLDNIRDSIMHEKFEIDEEKEIIIINNDKEDRIFKAEISFNWFINYIKKDIYSKRVSDKITINHFIDRPSSKGLTTFIYCYEIEHHILTKVDIIGDKLNIKELEEKVRFYLSYYSKLEPTSLEEEQYKDELLKLKNNRHNRIYYADRDLLTYINTKEKVINKLKEEYPDIDVKISIDNRKNRLKNKMKKNLPVKCLSYEDVVGGLNSLTNRKSNELIDSITSIYTKLDSHKKYDSAYLQRNIGKKEIINIVKGDEYYQSNNKTIDEYLFNKAKSDLMLIFIQVYVLSTLVINREDIYNKENIEKYNLSGRDKNIDDIRFVGFSKKSFDDHYTKKRKNTRDLMEKEIKLLKAKNNLRNVSESNTTAIEKISNNISKIENQLEIIKSNLEEIDNKYETYIYNPDEYYENSRKAIYNKQALELLFESFNDSDNIKLKEYLKSLILDLIDKTYEIEKEYFYGSTNLDETITIIRNSLSHIGRLVLKENRFDLLFNDYDDDGIKSGFVKGNIYDLIRLIEFPIPEYDLVKSEVEIKQLRYKKNK